MSIDRHVSHAILSLIVHNVEHGTGVGKGSQSKFIFDISGEENNVLFLNRTFQTSEVVNLILAIVKYFSQTINYFLPRMKIHPQFKMTMALGTQCTISVRGGETAVVQVSPGGGAATHTRLAMRGRFH